MREGLDGTGGIGKGRRWDFCFLTTAGNRCNLALVLCSSVALIEKIVLALRYLIKCCLLSCKCCFVRPGISSVAFAVLS